MKTFFFNEKKMDPDQKFMKIKNCLANLHAKTW